MKVCSENDQQRAAYTRHPKESWLPGPSCRIALCPARMIRTLDSSLSLAYSPSLYFCHSPLFSLIQASQFFSLHLYFNIFNKCGLLALCVPVHTHDNGVMVSQASFHVLQFSLSTSASMSVGSVCGPILEIPEREDSSFSKIHIWAIIPCVTNLRTALDYQGQVLRKIGLCGTLPGVFTLGSSPFTVYKF